MASINDLKRYNLHDVARALGLKRQHENKGNYHSPQHEDKNPSLSIYNRNDQWWFNDQSNQEKGASGSIIDLIIYIEGGDFKSALNRAHQLTGLPQDLPPATKSTPHRQQTLPELIAWNCSKEKERVKPYLIKERGISEAVVDRALELGCVGFNTWTNKKVQEGEFGYGGEAAAFIVRSLNPGEIKAVDMRYLDPAKNGGVKTQTQGEKRGFPWYMDLQKLKEAETVYVVESPINVMSIECCGLYKSAAIAVRAIKAVDQIDWSFFFGKKMVLCFDNDNEDAYNHCAGQEAAWKVYDLLSSKNIAARILDQSSWDEEDLNDVNDYLVKKGPEELKRALWKLQHWALQGQAGSDKQKGRDRIYLPGHDSAVYWRFRIKDDFTTFVAGVEQDPDTGHEKLSFADVCGFRIASISRIKVTSPNSVLSGAKDLQSRILYAVNVQTPRDGAELQRRVFEDEELHNTDKWTKFGPVYKKSLFNRLVNILERTAHLAQTKAINFVGLGWMDGKLQVNEGSNCYFSDPHQQCLYANLIFPTGNREQALQVVKAYEATFRKSAALLTLVWALGGHMKAFLGYWPHLVMQAHKGSGKSVLTKHLEGTLGMTVYGRQQVDSAFRVLTSVCHTSHPVGWEEISAGRQDVIDAAVSTLQQNYQYTLVKRGARQIDFLLSAPVLLAGEDVPVDSLEGKLVRTDLTAEKQGVLLRQDLPVFPVRGWLEYLATKTRQEVQDIHSKAQEVLESKCTAKKDDSVARRMLQNYAAVLTAYKLLSEYAGFDTRDFAFTDDLQEQMNKHINETESNREPWVWIMETILSEIDSNKYRHPYTWGDCPETGKDALFIRHTDMINHMRHNTHLRDTWNSMPIKSAKVLKESLQRAGVISTVEGEKQIHKRRVQRMLVLPCVALERYGLNPAFAEPHQNDFLDS